LRQARHGPYPEEAEDPVAHPFGVRYQVLVPHPVRALVEAFLHGHDQRNIGRPELGQRQHRVAGRKIRVRVEPEAVESPGGRLEPGGDHINGVPVHAQELRVGKHGTEHVGVLRRAPALVAVALLSPPPEVGRNHPVHGVAGPRERGVRDGLRAAHPVGGQRRALEL
jgi:hypothetical protein